MEKSECDIILRECGGWLAVSVKSCEIKIGVTGDTEEEAAERFADTLAKWRKSIADGRPLIPPSLPFAH